MEQCQTIDGVMFAEMLKAGAAELRAHVDEINDLNVFPIPDGDTGSNMLLTMMGGVNALHTESPDISEVSRTAADGMLLAARGNSGVILSQLFDGIARGLEGKETATAKELSFAVNSGVRSAYSAVLQPTEGTILTVARCAAEQAEDYTADSVAAYMNTYISEAKKALERTPDLLPVLKKAGVIDSGGAGWISILEGMNHALCGEESELTDLPYHENVQTLDFDKFTEDSILTLGYCTEVLLRLQNSKTDVKNFDVSVITDYLQTIGDSVVTFQTGSIVKIHVHTMTPDKVLAFCRQYGEFLTTKIENMSLQHNNTIRAEKEATPPKTYGVVAVCTGEGIREMFLERGVDAIVDGGQSFNPSAEDFLSAFSTVNAEHIFVLPNNGNVILAAEQAAQMFGESDVRVLPSKTIGEGYAALSMMNPDESDADTLSQEMEEAMAGVATAEITRCIRDAEMDGIPLHTGDYIGICGKRLLSVSENRYQAAEKAVDALGMSNYDICLIIRGANTPKEEAEQLAAELPKNYHGKEAYVVNGMQDIYDYILVLE